jgi:hypothetical protein
LGTIKVILHPSGVTCFGRLICQAGFKQTFEFIDGGSEKLFTKATSMNMSPRWGEESWRGTVGYKHLTSGVKHEPAHRLASFPGLVAALLLCGSPNAVSSD